MNKVIANLMKRGKPERRIFLEARLDENGRRLREVKSVLKRFWLWIAGRLIEIRIYKNKQAVIRLCEAWIEPELLRQLLSWSERGREPGLIIKHFKDTAEMEVT